MSLQTHQRAEKMQMGTKDSPPSLLMSISAQLGPLYSQVVLLCPHPPPSLWPYTAIFAELQFGVATQMLLSWPLERAPPLNNGITVCPATQNAPLFYIIGGNNWWHYAGTVLHYATGTMLAPHWPANTTRRRADRLWARWPQMPSGWGQFVYILYNCMLCFVFFNQLQTCGVYIICPKKHQWGICAFHFTNLSPANPGCQFVSSSVSQNQL